MLFIHPMWHDESERIGKQKCTPTGYALHGIAELIGLAGLVSLFVVPGILFREWWVGTFGLRLFGLFALPVGLGIVSEVMFQFSWWLAHRKGFRYDYEQSEASWMEAGERRSYKYDPRSDGGT